MQLMAIRWLCAGNFAIYNHLAKLVGSNAALSSFSATRPWLATKKPGRKPGFFDALSCGATSTLPVAVAVVACWVFLFILVASYQATAYYAGASADEGTLTAAYQATQYCTASTANSRSFCLAAPAFGFVLSLSYRAGQHKERQQKCENF